MHIVPAIQPCCTKHHLFDITSAPCLSQHTALPVCWLVPLCLNRSPMRVLITNPKACYKCRSIMRGTLQALAFCHCQSVAHGSMGSGSVLLSTYDDRRANDLIVKLDNFGFGRAHYACSLDLKGGMLQSGCMTPTQHMAVICQVKIIYKFLTICVLCVQERDGAPNHGYSQAGTQS